MDVEDDTHVVVGGLLQCLFDQLCIVFVQFSIQFVLQTLPHDGKANGLDSLVSPLRKVSRGREEIICFIFSGYDIAGKSGTTNIQPDQINIFCLACGTPKHKCESEEYSF